MGSSVANQNQTKKFAETGTSQWSYIVMKGAKIFPIISENKKFCWFKGHEIDNSTSINADIIKVIDIVGCEG